MLQRELVDVRHRQPRRFLETSLHRKIHRKFDRKISSHAERHVRHQGPPTDAGAVPKKAGNHGAAAT